jgi:hypothetical protein
MDAILHFCGYAGLPLFLYPCPEGVVCLCKLYGTSGSAKGRQCVQMFTYSPSTPHHGTFHSGQRLAFNWILADPGLVTPLQRNITRTDWAAGVPHPNFSSPHIHPAVSILSFSE